MGRDELDRTIAEDAAKATVKEMFTLLGIDVNNPDEIRHFRANMAWVFKFRRLSEKVGTTVILTIVTIVTGGFAKIVWDAVKTAKGGH